ncbi:small ribosomal subunit protein mS31 isoform X2 [Bubalus kerabau]|uniref:small ribosomal subunit protein mS31 isoform X2 n=1 Tax=Bubalus carabanensis TaxID=3119969 RepID=UPI000DBCA588|nr:28S ribosomal protein S31, mitochondrial isoform X2 [Bubalus carabanensis]
MFPRVSAVLPFRPLSRLPLCSAGPEASAATVVPLASPQGTVRTKCNIQRYFGTNSVIYSKKDDKSVPACEISKETENQGSIKENKKKDLVNIIKGMKVELSTVNVQTTKPPNRGQLKSLEAAIGRLQKSPEDAPQKSKSLSPELVAAATAVADSLPFDKQTTKSELLRQLRQHEEDWKAQKDGEKPKISFSNIISDMKVARSSTVRASTRPVHQIQFDEGADDFVDREKTADLRKSFRKNIYKGKRLNIFELKPVAEEAPETGFDDDGSEFHEHIFLDKYLEGFPKQGPIRHFMELVTCGLSKNPYLSVKQKVEHIEWFRNYFNEKQDILKESGINFS